MSAENLVYDDIWGGKDVKIDVTPTLKMAKEFISDNKGYLKGAALLIPLTLTACNSSASENVNISTNWPTIVGSVTGALLATEELFERDPDKNFGRKIIATAVKGTAGFCAGHALTNNIQNGGSWLSKDNLPETMILIPSAYALARESSFRQLREGVSNFVRGKAEKIAESRRMRNEEFVNKRIEKARKERVSIRKAAAILQETGMGNDWVAQQLIEIGWKGKDVGNLLGKR